MAEDLEYIQGIVPYYSFRELALINKYSEDFIMRVNFYQAQDLEQLIDLFADIGIKRFKSVNTKLEYLAIYQCILNHFELLPAEEISDELEEKMDKVKGDLEAVTKVFDEIANTKKNNSPITIANNKFQKRDDGKFLNKHLDLKFKWYCITNRQEEVFEWLKDTIMDSVKDQLDILHEKFGKDAEITFYTDDEDGEDIMTEYIKEPERKPSEVGKDPMYR